jgi:CDP-diacylglycerol--serine O-phosphatidyltransferase
MVCAVVYAAGAQPVVSWPLAVLWLGLLALLGFLMVSTWRYYSFKGINLTKAYSPLIVILVGGFIYGVWNYSQPLLLAMAIAYVGSGIVIRIGGLLRRRLRHSPPPVHPEHQIG